MTRPAPLGYHRSVPAPRSGARPWIAAGALLLTAVMCRPCTAGAAQISYEVADGAVVQVIGRDANVTIRTWNRNTVQIDYPDGDAFTPTKGSLATRASFLIPTMNVEEHSPDGPFIATLLPEDFPVPKLPPGMHDVVKVTEDPRPADPGRPPNELTVTVPASTGLVNVRMTSGPVTLNDYHGTTIALAGRGRIVFNNVGGDAFVQPLNGEFYATGSTFDRLRIRSNRANQIFDACRVKQIEATTLTGNIVFDNGAFDPGLARFESDRGSIALGVNGGAQLGAHTLDGHVLTTLPAAPAADTAELGREQGEALQVAGGGPLVNVSSNHGNVMLYDGSLGDHHPAAPTSPWRSPYDLLLNGREAARRRPPQVHALAGPPQQHFRHWPQHRPRPPQQ